MYTLWYGTSLVAHIVSNRAFLRAAFIAAVIAALSLSASGAARLDRTDYATGKNPTDLAVLDVNGDGDLDIVVGGQGAGYLKVLLGNGDGTFAAGPRILSGGWPSQLATGDFNADGRTDLAAVSGAGMRVFHGLAGGGLGIIRAYSFDGITTDVVSADLNADGASDLAFAFTATSHDFDLTGLAHIKYGYPGGNRFVGGSNFAAGEYPHGIAAGDFNDDGRLDVATGASNDDAIVVLYGQPDGSLASGGVIAGVGGPEGLVAADFNADGVDDLAVARMIARTITVFYGSGAGLGGREEYVLADQPSHLAAADMNGDGLIDIVASTGGVTILHNNGAGFDAPAVYDAPGALGIITADLNADGLNDVAVTNYTSQSISVFINGGNDVPILLGDTLPNGRVGLPYSADLEVTGGAAPYLWQVIVGSLPDGLLLDINTGTVSGTPTAAGIQGFSIRVIDAATEEDIQAYTVTIDPEDESAPAVVAVSVEAAPSLVREGLDDSVTVTATATDAALNATWIAGAEYFLDVDPGEGLGTAMAAVDAAFDSATEALTADINTSAWTAPDTHVVYVRARDVMGNWSATESVSIDVVSAPGQVTDLAVEAEPFFTALDGVVSDYSGEFPGMSVNNAVDGDPATVWKTAGSLVAEEEFVTVDLGAVQTPSAVLLTTAPTPSLFPRRLRIDVSQDAVDWTVLVDVKTRPARATFLWQFAPTPARYVRVTGTGIRSGDTRYYISLAEVLVYAGTGLPTATLTWTAPADDGDNLASGPVTAYTLKYAATAITEGTYAAATEGDVIGAIAAPGDGESATLTVTGRPGTWHFALKALDDEGSWSLVSNDASEALIAQGFVVLAPDDEAEVSATAPRFDFAGGPDVTKAWIQFSSAPFFPPTGVRADDELVDRTLRIAVRPWL